MSGGSRILVAQQEEGVFLVDNSELRADASEIAFRHSKHFDDKDELNGM